MDSSGMFLPVGDLVSGSQQSGFLSTDAGLCNLVLLSSSSRLLGLGGGGCGGGGADHLQSPRTIITRLINMKQLPPALTEPPPVPSPQPSPVDPSKTSPPPQALQQPPPAPSKIILKPRHRTSPAMWCAAIVCFAFSILLIVAGVVILIVFLSLRPRAPSFDAANAVLNSIYMDSPAPYFNDDMTLVANISNPNQKIDVVFRSGTIELFFQDRPMVAQALPPFALRRGQFQVVNMHMVSSRVLLPPEVAVKMVDQVRSNRVQYTVQTAFKVEARFSLGHYTYWMYTVCELELTSPPSGVLVARRCTAK
ncbi:hypothetical protein U9M48_038433 [Paspalum notatum var. saurae]|uniref:Late embryogenesis abundant protein LEA-2 subgroup domain-containing protein n=1 Tax=Paspalum notatum var. saurae TaxID=547442 RepID=A0AAQ3ULF0_PASNO